MKLKEFEEEIKKIKQRYPDADDMEIEVEVYFNQNAAMQIVLLDCEGDTINIHWSC